MSTPRSDVVIVGVGARTHTGSTPLQVAMTARAGRMMPREGHVVDGRGNAIAMCRLASISDSVWGIERLVTLAAPAVNHAAFAWSEAQLARLGSAPPIPVVIALPAETRPGFDPRLTREFLGALSHGSGVSFDERRSSLVFRDRGGGAEAFVQAFERLSRGDTDAVLVGGVDSFFDPDVLEWLDGARRLHGPDTEDGFMPGEGAGFVLLTTRGRASAQAKLAQVLGAAMELEPRPYGHEEPCHGLGMTLALDRACATLGKHSRRVGWALTDVVGERHRVDEWSSASLRAFRHFRENVVHDQALLSTGDLGAASTAVLTVMAAMRWRTGCGRDDVALVATHSDGPERGVVLLAEEPS